MSDFYDNPYRQKSLADLFNSDDPQDAEIVARMLAENEAPPNFDNEARRLGNYPATLGNLVNQPSQPQQRTDWYGQAQDAFLKQRLSGNTDTGIDFSGGMGLPQASQQSPQLRIARAANTGSDGWGYNKPDSYVDNRTGQITQGQRPTAPAELQPNSFRNNSTGVVTKLSDTQPMWAGQQQGQPEVLQQMTNQDGTISRILKMPAANGAAAYTTYDRVYMPGRSPNDMAQAKLDLNAAQIANLKGKTPEEEARAERLKALARDEANRVITSRMTPEERQAGAAKRAGVTLARGETYDEATGSVRSIQHSDLWNKQQKEMQTAKETRDQFNVHADAMIKNIDALIGKQDKPKDHEGFRGATGMIDAALPPMSPQQKNARVIQEAIKNQASVEGLTGIRAAGTAPGSITEKEWPIFQSQNGNMDYGQDEKAYTQALKDKRAAILESKARVGGNYNSVLNKYGSKEQQSDAPVPVVDTKNLTITTPTGQIMRFPSGAALEGARRQMRL